METETPIPALACRYPFWIGEQGYLMYFFAVGVRPTPFNDAMTCDSLELVAVVEHTWEIVP